MSSLISFDHLAIGVERWEDGIPLLVNRLGGVWTIGGDAGEYRPCQLRFDEGISLELISTGSEPDGFMHRFLRRSGPGPHHLTFVVPSLVSTLGELEGLGLDAFEGRDFGEWRRETFIHPRVSGLGTLIQLVQVDPEVLAAVRGAQQAPPDWPLDGLPLAAGFAWVAMVVPSLDYSDRFFGDVLRGRKVAGGETWTLYSWGASRRILVRAKGAVGGEGWLWPAAVGVAHLMVGPGDALPDADGNASGSASELGEPRLGLTVAALTSSPVG
jgi:hypothetical protein